MFKKKIFMIVSLLVVFGMCVCVCLGLTSPAKAGLTSLQSRTCVTTYIYKKVGDLEIKADVHQVMDDVKRPVIVWIHGGALMIGGRESFPAQAKESFFASGYDIISIDYRLAPETKLPAIIEDLEDAFKWIYEQGPELLEVDASKIAVMGGSAGGYLALMAGYRVKPRPTVIVSQWGYGDLVGPWQSESSPHHKSTMTDERAKEIAQLPPITNSRDRKANGWAFYNYCRKHGLWPEMATDWNLQTEKEKYYPYMPLKNVTKDFPPTLLIHGTKDTDVPYEQSELMEKEFVKHGVPYEFLSVKDAGHSLRGAKREEFVRAMMKPLEFINKYMKN